MTRETYAQINKRNSTHLPREFSPALWDATDHIYEDSDHRFYTDAWCQAHQEQALKNYDLNIAFYASLDHAEFDESLNQAISKQRGMVEVTDLNDWSGTPGLYVMVLDDYRQAYVGQTTRTGGIKARIRAHWSSSKSFDRLIFGSPDESILSIDSFRALDTTRIFAAKLRDPIGHEDKLLHALPAKFTTNRINGGRPELIALQSALVYNIIRTHQLS